MLVRLCSDKIEVDLALISLLGSVGLTIAQAKCVHPTNATGLLP